MHGVGGVHAAGTIARRDQVERHAAPFVRREGAHRDPRPETERGRQNRSAKLRGCSGDFAARGNPSHRERLARGPRDGRSREGVNVVAPEDERALATLVGEHVVHDRVEVGRVDLAMRREDARGNARYAPDPRVVGSPGERIGERRLELAGERGIARERLVDALENGHRERAAASLHQTCRRERPPRDDAYGGDVVTARPQPIDVRDERFAERPGTYENDRRVADGRSLDDVVMPPRQGLELPHRARERERDALGKRAVAACRRRRRRGEGPSTHSRLQRADKGVAELARRRGHGLDVACERAFVHDEEGAAAVLRGAAGDQREIERIRHTGSEEHPPGQVIQREGRRHSGQRRRRARRGGLRDRVNHDSQPARGDLRQIAPCRGQVRRTRDERNTLARGGRLRALPDQDRYVVVPLAREGLAERVASG